MRLIINNTYKYQADSHKKSEQYKPQATNSNTTNTNPSSQLFDFKHFDKKSLSSLIALLERLLSQLQGKQKPPEESISYPKTNPDPKPDKQGQTIKGTPRPDRLVGTLRDDHISGLKGNDRIRGRAGDDHLFGNEGRDKLIGGRGNDTLHGGKGRDTLIGGRGNDTLHGGKGADHLYGGKGNDIFVDNRGKNIIKGGQGEDEVRFSGKRADYSILVRNETFIFKNKQTGNVNKVTDVETFTFKDQQITLSDLKNSHIGGEDQQYHTIDGRSNNLQHPDIGKVDSPLRNFLPKDNDRAIGGVKHANLPNAREISNAVFDQPATESTQNSKGLSDMFWLWGQFLDHDIDLTPTNKSEPASITVPANDPDFVPGSKIPFNRSVAIVDPNTGERSQTNRITAVIDGSNIYGTSQAVQNEIRSFEGGKLIVDQNNRLPKDSKNPQFFLSGDIRVNENVGLTSMHTIWVREHNSIANQLATENPDWDDNKLFQEARKQVVGEMQAITANEFLPQMLGGEGLSKYQGYNPNVSPQISNAFSTAAYRFGHTMISPNILRLNEQGEEIPEGNLKLRNAFFQPTKVEEAGVDPILRGFAAQTAQAVDTKLVDDIRNFLFDPSGEGSFDLAALNIQRGRDHGLPSYNDARIALGAKPLKSFADFGEAGQRLSTIYDSPDDVDLWVGGLTESPEGDSLFGTTFTNILKEQFERTRDGDRFWYENRFSGKELHDLNNVTLADIIKRNTGVENIQDNVFVASNNITQTPNVVTTTRTPLNTNRQGANGADQAPLNTLIPLAEVADLITNTVEVSQAEANAIIARARTSATAERALAENALNQ
ncbi:MAG TPA: hypothetical protein ENJ33_02935 [Thiothrix sp.]|nr:hypothetical protein [Thiothrix sp.]